MSGCESELDSEFTFVVAGRVKAMQKQREIDNDSQVSTAQSVWFFFIFSYFRIIISIYN